MEQVKQYIGNREPYIFLQIPSVIQLSLSSQQNWCLGSLQESSLKHDNSGRGKRKLTGKRNYK